jgi:hypothetical protein
VKMYVPIFCFSFFDILKYVKYVFQNIKSICSQKPKHHSLHFPPRDRTCCVHQKEATCALAPPPKALSLPTVVSSTHFLSSNSSQTTKSANYLCLFSTASRPRHPHARAPMLLLRRRLPHPDLRACAIADLPHQSWPWCHRSRCPASALGSTAGRPLLTHRREP